MQHRSLTGVGRSRGVGLALDSLASDRLIRFPAYCTCMHQQRRQIRVLADLTPDARWTELKLKTLGAIVIVSTEEDVVQTVRKALGLLHPATLLTVQVKLAAELQRFTHQY